MRTPTNAYRPNADAYKGKTIRTTNGREGVVESAEFHAGKVRMSVRETVNGYPTGSFFHTDNEHATIVRER